jgi:ferrous iron transport protein B
VNFGERAAVVIDLPGTYSLEPLSPDEAVVLRVLDGEIAAAPDALIVVADACSLERSLPFVGQVLLRGRPTCLVLTMTDELAARGGTLDLPRLERALGIPVLGVVGHRGRGLDALVRLLGRPEEWSRPVLPPPSDPIERSRWADSVFANTAGVRPGIHKITEAVDRVVLHPVAGSLLFVAVMVTFFQLIFAWATPAMNVIDAAIRRARAFCTRHSRRDSWSTSSPTAGHGVGAVIAFLPQIALLFGLLYLLEDVGYLARAAFVVDRLMGRVGLEGRAFVALCLRTRAQCPGSWRRARSRRRATAWSRSWSRR